MNNEDQIKQNEVVLDENEMVCALTNKIVKVTDKELALQSMITMLTDEYGFGIADMERDFSVKFQQHLPAWCITSSDMNSSAAARLPSSRRLWLLYRDNCAQTCQILKNNMSMSG